MWDSVEEEERIKGRREGRIRTPEGGACCGYKLRMGRLPLRALRMIGVTLLSQRGALMKARKEGRKGGWLERRDDVPFPSLFLYLLSTYPLHTRVYEKEVFLPLNIVTHPLLCALLCAFQDGCRVFSSSTLACCSWRASFLFFFASALVLMVCKLVVGGFSGLLLLLLFLSVLSCLSVLFFVVVLAALSELSILSVLVVVSLMFVFCCLVVLWLVGVVS